MSTMSTMSTLAHVSQALASLSTLAMTNHPRYTPWVFASVLRLVVVKPLRVNLPGWLSPSGLAPLTTCAQVDKSERKLAKFTQVRVIFAGAP